MCGRNLARDMFDPSRERFLERERGTTRREELDPLKLTAAIADMASSGCWKCLSRPNTSQLIQGNHAALRLPTIAATAGFSTSAVMSKNPLAAKPKGAFGQNMARGGKTLKIKKKPPPVRSGKPPAEGERKALRKRIVLSNTNALEVELEDLGMSNVSSEGLAGKVVGLSGSTVDSLRASEAFKITQGWNLFRRPAILVREESVICAKVLEEAGAEKKTERLVVDGGRVSGKSLMISWRVDFIVWRWNGFSLALSGQSLLVERKKCYIIRRKTIDHRNTQLRNSRVIIVYSNGIEQFKFMREDVNGKTFNDCRNKIQMQD